jgi:hypothetical protein
MECFAPDVVQIDHEHPPVSPVLVYNSVTGMHVCQSLTFSQVERFGWQSALIKGQISRY